MDLTRNHFLDKSVFINQGEILEKIRAPAKNLFLKKNFRYFSTQPTHQITNKKNVKSSKTSTNVLLKSNHSKQSLSTKINDHDKKNILKYQSNESSSRTKWTKLLKNRQINSDNHLLVIVTTWVKSEEKTICS